MALTTCGRNGGSRALFSNFFQSISSKKTLSVISPCGLFSAPNLVFGSFSKSYLTNIIVSKHKKEKY